ncbi:hypothetical protein PCANC_08818 [Puccinia coronata f. sp. avenae]|uniref:Uncharacterized protein n=1 Tax=Puccinia coronata f. sp. avenae TaxID=200324 RepID=A0A2N5V846_9BASI|nr:hypothetical protein PCANC_08818 [Puccinia coronata f. sp. avenae]
MSSGLIFPTALSSRTDKNSEENINCCDPLGPVKNKHSLPSHLDKGTIIVRRPFKYLKHQGPRPVGANLASTFRYHNANGSEDSDCTEKLPLLSSNFVHTTASHERFPAPDLKAEKKPQSDTERPVCEVQRNETPQKGPPASRLLSSRKLNLTALNISACQKRKSSEVEVVRDELSNPPLIYNDENLTMSPATARLSAWFYQNRTSCFSDWSNSAPASGRCSGTICEASTQLNYLPKSSREIARKHRISSDPRLPMSVKREPRSCNNTRSRSDFGLTS